MRDAGIKRMLQPLIRQDWMLAAQLSRMSNLGKNIYTDKTCATHGRQANKGGNHRSWKLRFRNRSRHILLFFKPWGRRVVAPRGWGLQG